MESVPSRTRRIALFSLLVSLLPISSAHALDSGYIEAVEADMSEFITKEFHAPENSKWLGSDDNAAAEMDDLAGFANYLQSKSPGSYIFYKKLPIDYQKRLHQDYLATGDLERIKQDIFKYTRQVKK